MSMYMPGATAVGITFDGGIVLASEKRIAFGNFLVSKSTKKTFEITPKVGATCAGLVADMQILTLQIAALAKIRNMELKRDVPPNSVAKMMSNMMYERRYFPLLTQVIVGGVVDKPVLYTLDPLGSVLPDEQNNKAWARWSFSIAFCRVVVMWSCPTTSSKPIGLYFLADTT